MSVARPRLYKTNEHPSDKFRAPKTTLTLTHTPENGYQTCVSIKTHRTQHLPIATVATAPHHGLRRSHGRRWPRAPRCVDVCSRRDHVISPRTTRVHSCGVSKQHTIGAHRLARTHTRASAHCRRSRPSPTEDALPCSVATAAPDGFKRWRSITP